MKLIPQDLTSNQNHHHGNTAPTHEDCLLTPAELAMMLAVKESWLARNRIGESPIPYKKFGKIIRYDILDVRKWVKKRTKQ